jgi:hypothetical protein
LKNSIGIVHIRFLFLYFFERIFDTVLSWYKLFQVSEGSSFRTSRKFWFYCWYVGNLILSKNFFCSPQLIERRFFTAITDTFLFYSFFGKHDCVSTGAELLHYVEVYDALITTLCRLSNDKTILFFCYQKRRPQEEIKFFQKLIHFFEIYLVSVKSSLFYTRIFFLNWYHYRFVNMIYILLFTFVQVADEYLHPNFQNCNLIIFYGWKRKCSQSSSSSSSVLSLSNELPSSYSKILLNMTWSTEEWMWQFLSDCVGEDSSQRFFVLIWLLDAIWLLLVFFF